MTSIHLINLANYPTSLRNTLQILRSQMTSSRKIILRIADSSERLIDPNMIHMKRDPTRRAYDEDDNGRYSNFSSTNPYQAACVELLKAVADIDINLPMGYTVLEIPNTPKPTLTDVEMDCFATIEELYNYLASANAVPYFPKEPRGETHRAAHGHSWRATGDDEMDISEQSWGGMEEIVPQEQPDSRMIQSTMVFRVEYHYVETTIESAIEFLTAELMARDSRNVLARERKLTITATGDRIEALVYVIPNTSCTFQIIKESQHFTIPVSKQRVLFIYDCIRAWIQEHQKMWIEIRRNTRPLKAGMIASCFQYRVEKMSPGFKSFPTLTIERDLIVKDFSINATELWHSFGGSLALPEKITAVIDFMGRYGIEMTVEGLAGPMEDYVDDRVSFTLPVRETPPPIITAQYRGRSRGRSMEYERGGRGATYGDRGATRGSRGATHHGRGVARGGHDHDTQDDVKETPPETESVSRGRVISTRMVRRNIVSKIKS